MNKPLMLGRFAALLTDPRIEKMPPDSLVTPERFNDMDWLKFRSPDGEVIYLPLSEPG